MADPADVNASANLIAGAPITAQTFSAAAPFMVPNTHAKLRAAMMQAPGVQGPQFSPDPSSGDMTGFGG